MLETKQVKLVKKSLFHSSIHPFFLLVLGLTQSDEHLHFFKENENKTIFDLMNLAKDDAVGWLFCFSLLPGECLGVLEECLGVLEECLGVLEELLERRIIVLGESRLSEEGYIF